MPVEIWNKSCRHCPSTKEPDPEFLDIQTWPKEKRIEIVFVCGWRTSKLCKGFCDAMGITEADLMEKQNVK